MQRLLRWLVGLPVVIVVLAFAVANRKWVTLSFNPFTKDVQSVDLPLWLLFFLGIFSGIVMGWIGSWIGQGKHRRAAREAKAEAQKLQLELADLRKPQDLTRQQDVVPFNGGLL